MTFLLGWLLALLSMLAFALAQPKQARLLISIVPESSSRWILICLGSALLVASGYQAIAAYGVGVGIVTFFSHACFGAWCISLSLTWRRSRS